MYTRFYPLPPGFFFLAVATRTQAGDCYAAEGAFL